MHHPRLLEVIASIWLAECNDGSVPTGLTMGVTPALPLSPERLPLLLRLTDIARCILRSTPPVSSDVVMSYRFFYFPLSPFWFALCGCCVEPTERQTGRQTERQQAYSPMQSFLLCVFTAFFVRWGGGDGGGGGGGGPMKLILCRKTNSGRRSSGSRRGSSASCKENTWPSLRCRQLPLCATDTCPL